MNNEKRATQLVAKLIALIHGHPRTAMKALTAEDGKDFLRDADRLVSDEESREEIIRRGVARTTGDDTLEKRFDPNADPARVLAKVHEHGRPVLGAARASEGTRLGGIIEKGHNSAMMKVISDRFDHDRKD